MILVVEAEQNESNFALQGIKSYCATAEGDIRSAFFLSYEESKCEYVPIEGNAIEKALASGRKLVSTTFIIPYPPGFPILVPGQVISQEIVTFMCALDVKEIHGYRTELGLRIFTDEALARQMPAAVVALPAVAGWNDK